jgi:hypothetical protein
MGAAAWSISAVVLEKLLGDWERSVLKVSLGADWLKSRMENLQDF